MKHRSPKLSPNRLLHVIFIFLIYLSTNASGSSNIAILKYSTPLNNMDFVGNITQALIAKDFNVQVVTPAQAADVSILSPDKFSLYIVPNAQFYPTPAINNLKNYLKNKGNILFLSGPVLQRFLVESQQTWLDKDILKDVLAKQPPNKMLFDFENNPDISNFKRITNTPQNNSKIGIVNEGINNSKCLKVLISNLQGWDLYKLPINQTHFQNDCNAITFWAKADEGTEQLAIEIRQWDSSRWFASVDLTTKWKKYVLLKEDFKFWTHGSPDKNDNNLNLQNIYYLCIGLSESNSRISKGRHVLYIDNIATTSSPFKNVEFANPPYIEPIETFVPAYKGYPIENFSSIKSTEILGNINHTAAFKSAYCSQKRTRSTGFSGNPKFRWIPLAYAFDKANNKKDTIAWMLINRLGHFKGSSLACLGINDTNAYKDKSVIEIITKTAQFFDNKLFLYKAGSEHFTYKPSQKATLGYEIINKASIPQKAKVKITISSGDKIIFEDTQPHTIPAESAKNHQLDYQLPDKADKLYKVKTELIKDSKCIDSLSHELAVADTLKHEKNDFISVKGPDFYLKDQKWYPVGVNYWPQYVSGLDVRIYWSNWLKPGQYDPHMVDQDLQIMHNLGINMASIQIKHYESGHNLLDFLRRCEKYNIKVNLAMVEDLNAKPIDFDPTQAQKLVEDFGLATNPAIFAYDIIWEPGNYVFSNRMIDRWDDDWKNWIIDRYGSIENAEKDWNYKILDNTGKILHPTPQQFEKQGSHRIMVAAYRRFMDDLMSKKWNIATRKLREFIPNQLISFRQGNTLPHDFTITATAKHVDFFCPEGYSIRGNEDGYNSAAFLSRYIDFVTKSKPIIWSEFGVSVWDHKTHSPSQGRINYQKNYSEMFYKVVLETGCNGIAPWWWPGGFREGENSDYGLLNQDSTPRPALKLLEKYAPLMKTPRKRPKLDEFITIDRDNHPGGYWYLAFHKGKDIYAQLKKQNKMMGIKTNATGTDSSNTPRIAVGNTKYTGKNPIKYLNAEFNYFKIKDISGSWVEVKNGNVIHVKKGFPVLAKTSIGNTQQAKWLSPNGRKNDFGCVYLTSLSDSDITFAIPIPNDTDYLTDIIFEEFILYKTPDTEKNITLSMSAKDRAIFGEVLRFKISPE